MRSGQPGRGRLRGALVRSLLASLLLGLGACAPEARVELDSLAVEDSVYLDPATGEPFTGLVFRPFPDAETPLQLEGRLEEGVWSGELTVWHRDGSLRYQGRLVDGTPCGAWLENREPGETESVHEALRREIESLGLYPPCPE